MGWIPADVILSPEIVLEDEFAKPEGYWYVTGKVIYLDNLYLT